MGRGRGRAAHLHVEQLVLQPHAPLVRQHGRHCPQVVHRLQDTTGPLVVRPSRYGHLIDSR